MSFNYGNFLLTDNKNAIFKVTIISDQLKYYKEL